MSVTGDNKVGNFSSVYVSSNAQVNGNLNVSGTITSGGGTGSTLDLADGSTGAPSLSFTNDGLTGLYRDSTGGSGIGFTTNGTKRLKVSSTAVNSTVPIQINDGGGASAPSITFATDTSSGIFRGAGGTTSISSVGTEVFRVNSSQLQSFVPIAAGSNQISCGSLSSSALILGSQTIKNIISGTFTLSTTLSGLGVVDNLTQNISKVPNPVSILLTLSTPTAGDYGWSRVIITLSQTATSWSAGTNILTLGYNLSNWGSSAISNYGIVYYTIFC